MKRLRFCLVIVLAALSVSTIAAHAAEWLVKPDGSGDAPTIQAAIDSASNGDVILLANGVFTGDGNRNIFIIRKNITIESQSAEPESCIIDCEGSGEDQRYGFQL
ncbi:MAG: hypothetical protein GTO29_14320 [Candidatus Latescibacteria bacterium]|nr:hypothetical protein [Candidatus Latescibacterota bacterium]NIO57321.1 hypothetical protein [Candidatus Latescibacterota bacterium]